MKSWKRQPREDDTAYAYFSEWLHASDDEGDRPGVYEWACNRAENAQWRAYILSCSTAFQWRERGRDYDEHTSTKVIRKVYPLVGPLFMSFYQLVRVELEKLKKEQEASGGVSFIPLNTLIRIATMLARSEKWVKELHLKEKEVAHNLGPGEAAVDYSLLSVDEVRTLEMLNQKATVH